MGRSKIEAPMIAPARRARAEENPSEENEEQPKKTVKSDFLKKTDLKKTAFSNRLTTDTFRTVLAVTAATFP